MITKPNKPPHEPSQCVTFQTPKGPILIEFTRNTLQGLADLPPPPQKERPAA
jgi:hypothetical protein